MTDRAHSALRLHVQLPQPVAVLRALFESLETVFPGSTVVAERDTADELIVLLAVDRLLPSTGENAEEDRR